MKTGWSQENSPPIPPVTHIYWVKSIFSVLFTYAVVRSWGYTDCKIIKISIGRSSYINLVTKERHPGDTYVPICVNVYFISSLQTYSFILNQVSITFVLRKPLCPRVNKLEEELKMGGEKLQFCSPPPLSKYTPPPWLRSLNFQLSKRLSGRARSVA